VHRNTYINGPTVLRETWQTRARADLFFAGQISGVEGYVESAASGLIAGRNAAALALGEEPTVPPRTTAIGALAYYVSHADPHTYQPTNITFGIMPPPDVVSGRTSVVSGFPGPPKPGTGGGGGRTKTSVVSGFSRTKVKKADRKAATSERALSDLEEWLGERAAPILP
jgi:folate-dependent tRNA-U54 methylase TrmFO/GidA